MKRILIALFLLTAVGLVAQNGYQLPVWLGKPAWVKLGPTLSLINGQLDVVSQPAVAKQRIYDQALIYDPIVLGWPLPANANLANFVVRVNGLGYARGKGNWEVTKPNLTGPAVIKPLADNMKPDFEVVIDYDPQ
jgi:hypothetical protein